jgi:hypothetical protein
MTAAFRRNEDYAVWDERGLTIRHGDRSRSGRLEEVVVSPRFFSKAEIQETVKQIHAGRRTKAASALSGAVRSGRYAYFLVRWEDSKHRPWAEFLVRVLLGSNGLWPEVVGRFEGLSLGYKPIDDRLFVLGENLAVVTRQAQAWGIASFDPRTRAFEFRGLGNDLLSFMPTGRKTALYVERTRYGLVQAGRADLGSGERAPLFEARGNARFVDALRPLVVVSSTADSARLHNAETGAEWTIPVDNGVGRIGSYILVWTPYASPTSATLYQPDRWTVVRRWSAKP